MAASGFTPEVRITPDPTDDDRFAQVVVAGEVAATEDDQALARAVGSRSSYRGAMQLRQVPDELFLQLIDEAAKAGVWVRHLEDESGLVGASLNQAALARLEEQRPYRTELAQWTGRATFSADGVPASAVPARGEGPLSTWQLREFDQNRTGELPMTPDTVEHPRVLLLGSENDTPHDWVQTGRALGRTLLRAEVLGLAASLMTVATEDTSTREQLRGALHGKGWPQVLLRIGFSGEHAGQTGRRPLSEVLAPSPPVGASAGKSN